MSEGVFIILVSSLFGFGLIVWGVFDDIGIRRAWRTRKSAEKPRAIEVTKRSVHRQAIREWDREYARLIDLYFVTQWPTQQEIEEEGWEIEEVHSFDGRAVARFAFDRNGNPAPLVPRNARSRGVV